MKLPTEWQSFDEVTQQRILDAMQSPFRDPNRPLWHGANALLSEGTRILVEHFQYRIVDVSASPYVISFIVETRLRPDHVMRLSDDVELGIITGPPVQQPREIVDAKEALLENIKDAASDEDAAHMHELRGGPTT